MHSSRMRTGRSFIVCQSLLRGGVLLGRMSALGGVCFWWGVYSLGEGVGVSAPAGVSAPGGVCSRGCLLPRVVVASQHALRQTLLLTE